MTDAHSHDSPRWFPTLRESEVKTWGRHSCLAGLKELSGGAEVVFNSRSELSTLGDTKPASALRQTWTEQQAEVEPLRNSGDLRSSLWQGRETRAERGDG